MSAYGDLPENAHIHLVQPEVCSIVTPLVQEFCPAATPLAAIPAPPLPRVIQSLVMPHARLSESESISSSTGDTLNPDVPEFVPVITSGNTNEIVMNHNENNQSKDEATIANAIGDLTAATDEPSVEAESSTELSTVQMNGEIDPVANDVWKEVKRRVKQPPKDKREEGGRVHMNKLSCKNDQKEEVREELDFQFDEELDTPPPTGRHNAFSEW